MSVAEYCACQELEERMLSAGGSKFPEACRNEAFMGHVNGGQGFTFDADDWYFYEHAPGREEHVRRIHIHFCSEEGARIKELLKQYAAWRLGRVRPVTVRLELSEYLKHWLRYLHIRSITQPEQFGSYELERFWRWLSLQGMRPERCQRIFDTVWRLLVTGQRLGWQVTKDGLPKKVRCREMLAGQKQETGVTQPIPPCIYDRILRHALCDETDEITRSGIIIQSQTGLRISEVLSLRKNCLKKDKNGHYHLIYSLKKTTRSGPQQRMTPANELVCEAVRRLENATEALRLESGRKELFLIRNHGIRPVSQANWNQGRLKNFMQRWEITDEKGDLYKLHSHQFRAAYVRRQLLEGGRIEEIQGRFGHVSPEMTARYVHLSPEDLQTMLAPVTGAMGRC